MRRIILVCVLGALMASMLFAASPKGTLSVNYDQNRAGELKVRIDQLKAQHKFDAALWHEYESLINPESVRHPARHLDQGGDNCASATVIASLPYSDTGTTTGFTDDYGDCVGGGSPDVVYAFTPASNISVNISLCGSFYDTGLEIYVGPCPGTLLVCNDDFCALQSEIDNVALTAGTTYYFVVDGFAGDAGDYVINVTEFVPPVTGRCCYSNNLLCTTTTQDVCAALGGDFTANETCDTPCPPPPPQCVCGPMDLVFVIDTTGSMAGAIANVVAELPNIITTANYFSCDVQLGLVTFGDQVAVNEQLTTNEAAVQASIAALIASGGSGIPEASDEALLEVINGTAACVVNPWTSVFRPTATKILVLVTDAPPAGCDDNYTPGVDDVHAHAVALAAQAAGIRIAAIYVHTTPSNDGIIVPVMQDYATTTSGVYREVLADGEGTGGAIASLVADCGQGILQILGQPPTLTCTNGVVTPNPAAMNITVTNAGNLACTGVTLTIGAGTGTGGTGTMTPHDSLIGTLAAGASVVIPVSAALVPDTAGGDICFHASLTSDACPPAFLDICFTVPPCQPVAGCECAIADPCVIPPGCFRTETQGAWGGTCHGGNAACILDNNFATVFPSGLTVGGIFTLTLTSAAAVEAFLPATGTPSVLTSNHTDPLTTEAGVFAGQVVTLAITLGFSNANVPTFCSTLGDLVIPTGVHTPAGPFAGWTVNQVFALANQVLGGNLGALPAGITVSDLNGVIDAINNNFDDGNVSEGYLVAPDCDEILPVELQGFTAEGNVDGIHLRWVTASERNIARYDVARQGADGAWTTIARITGLGDNAAGHTYTYLDGDVVAGTLYSYRLTTRETDGSVHPLGLTVSATPTSEGTVTDYALHQNYPNPFNPATSIAFDLAEAGKVSLKVYDVMGQQVANLVDGHMAAGRHTINFDASSLASGVYLYRLNVNGFTSQKKMLLVR